MNERIVVEHATKVQVANLAQSRTLKVTKPQGDQSIVLDFSDRNATFDLSAVADEKMTLVKAGPKLIILFDNQSTVTVDDRKVTNLKPRRIVRNTGPTDTAHP